MSPIRLNIPKVDDDLQPEEGNGEPRRTMFPEHPEESDSYRSRFNAQKSVELPSGQELSGLC